MYAPGTWNMELGEFGAHCALKSHCSSREHTYSYLKWDLRLEVGYFVLLNIPTEIEEEIIVLSD